MENRFTQGEWYAKEGQIYPLETGKTLATIPYFDENDLEQKANAQLISAALDLLEAYKTLFAAVENNTLENDFFALREQFRTVIQKAQGE